MVGSVTCRPFTPSSATTTTIRPTSATAVRTGAAGALWEFPPLVWRSRLLNLPAGGGWGLRLFPYRMIRSAAGRLNRAGHPAVFFVHPREFDPAPPPLPLPLLKRFVLYAGTASTEDRLGRLLQDFRFGTISGFLREAGISVA